MHAVDLWKHQNIIMEACKQQNYEAMQAEEPWVACKQQNCGSMQAAELSKHASSRTMEACKQQNHHLTCRPLCNTTGHQISRLSNG